MGNVAVPSGGGKTKILSGSASCGTGYGNYGSWTLPSSTGELIGVTNVSYTVNSQGTAPHKFYNASLSVSGNTVTVYCSGGGTGWRATCNFNYKYIPK
jgi:hypothetical protein